MLKLENVWKTFNKVSFLHLQVQPLQGHLFVDGAFVEGDRKSVV